MKCNDFIINVCLSVLHLFYKLLNLCKALYTTLEKVLMFGNIRYTDEQV